MGGSVEKVIALSTQALEQKSIQELPQIFEEEKRINTAHMKLDEDCFKMIARHAPKASDLRLLLAIRHVNHELERMGDLARNIAYGVRDLVNMGWTLHDRDVTALSGQVRLMVRQVLDAVTRDDEERASAILSEDDIVDTMRDNLIKKITATMKQDADSVESGIELIFIVRSLERIADHATNIAEGVIFVRSGQDVRHGQKL